MNKNEAFARTLIDAQLKDQGWNNDGVSIRHEYTIDANRADYLLCSREGRGLAIVEAKRESINAADAVVAVQKLAPRIDRADVRLFQNVTPHTGDGK